MLRNVPLALKLYAALAFLAALGALWRIVAVLSHGGSIGRVLWELLWAGFEVALGIGVLRFQSWARVAALICCWFMFILFGIVLVCWCIWPHSMTGAVFAVATAATALNLYFYVLFRRTDIRAMYHMASSRPL